MLILGKDKRNISLKSQVIRFARLPVFVSLAEMQEEVRNLPSQWKAHLNERDYEGTWTVLSLRAPGGDAGHIAGDALGENSYGDTPLMTLVPSVKRLLDSLPFTPNGVRLLRLGPDSNIREHRDPDLSFEQGEARLHFPVFTHPGIAFFVDGERLQMKEGECWYVNANLPHSVSNPGPEERIHLVVDAEVTEGLRALFAHSEISYSTVSTPGHLTETLAIIRELRLQNSPVSLSLADELEKQVREHEYENQHASESPSNALLNWIPAGLVRLDEQWLCEWLYAGDLRFTNPFFQETLERCRCLSSNLHPYRSVSDLSVLSKWSRENGTIPLSGLIFHVSRCGSTLVSQLLGLDPAHIVLSEAPLLDDILRLSFRDRTINVDIKEIFRAALSLYGQPREGNECRLFAKLDSWHICFYNQLRAWYPELPFFLLYRAPEAVLQSHRRQRGMQSVPGMIEPEILWGQSDPPPPADLDAYMANVLQVYMEKFREIVGTDPHAYLLNYGQGIGAAVEKIAAVTGIPITEDLKNRMETRSGFHGKYPGQPFREEKGTSLDPAMLATLEQLYQELESIRLGQ